MFGSMLAMTGSRPAASVAPNCVGTAPQARRRQCRSGSQVRRRQQRRTLQAAIAHDRETRVACRLRASMIHTRLHTSIAGASATVAAGSGSGLPAQGDHPCGRLHSGGCGREAPPGAPLVPCRLCWVLSAQRRRRRRPVGSGSTGLDLPQPRRAPPALSSDRAPLLLYTFTEQPLPEGVTEELLTERSAAGQAAREASLQGAVVLFVCAGYGKVRGWGRSGWRGQGWEGWEGMRRGAGWGEAGEAHRSAARRGACSPPRRLPPALLHPHGRGRPSALSPRTPTPLLHRSRPNRTQPKQSKPLPPSISSRSGSSTRRRGRWGCARCWSTRPPTGAATAWAPRSTRSTPWTCRGTPRRCWPTCCPCTAGWWR